MPVAVTGESPLDEDIVRASFLVRPDRRPPCRRRRAVLACRWGRDDACLTHEALTELPSTGPQRAFRHAAAIVLRDTQPAFARPLRELRPGRRLLGADVHSRDLSDRRGCLAEAPCAWRRHCDGVTCILRKNSLPKCDECASLCRQACVFAAQSEETDVTVSATRSRGTVEPGSKISPVMPTSARAYGCRSAIIGSMSEARRAGRNTASPATATSISETAATVAM